LPAKHLYLCSPFLKQANIVDAKIGIVWGLWHAIRPIAQAALEYGRYGYRRITALLQRDGWQMA